MARLRGVLNGAVVGQKENIELLLICLLTGGHMLIEGPPGTGKTFLLRCLSRALDLSFSRVQASPDLTGGDILGSEVLDRESGCRLLMRGPVFSNLVLFDEMNRANPKVQSALLEAMAEGQVSFGGPSHRLPRPHLVIATQNPHDHQSTYVPPRPHLDRFMFQALFGYAERGLERELMEGKGEREVGAVADAGDLCAAQQALSKVEVAADILDLAHSIVCATRERKEAVAGASTRCAMDFAMALRARALLSGRCDAKKEDVGALAAPLLRHRVALGADSLGFGYKADDMIADIVRRLI